LLDMREYAETAATLRVVAAEEKQAAPKHVRSLRADRAGAYSSSVRVFLRVIAHFEPEQAFECGRSHTGLFAADRSSYRHASGFAGNTQQ
jgi:hypothetical protein